MGFRKVSGIVYLSLISRQSLGGTGLGLAMSYKIIEAMGGSITFESVENEGTTFYVVLKQDN